MGRPPLGKIAMSNAERQRRFRASHGHVAKHVTKRAPPDGVRLAALQREVAQLKAENAEKDDKIKRLGAMAEELISRMPDEDGIIPQLDDLQRQLETRKTRMRWLEKDRKLAWKVAREENHTVISNRDRRKLLAALHPDAEASPERKKVLTEASQIINGLNMHTPKD